MLYKPLLENGWIIKCIIDVNRFGNDIESVSKNQFPYPLNVDIERGPTVPNNSAYPLAHF